MASADATTRSALSFVEHTNDTLGRHRTSIAWLTTAAISLVAAFAITTIRVRDSIFDAFALRLLVVGLTGVAVTHILLAFGLRNEKWHIATWGVVASAWLVTLWVT
ncbi:MAG: hypothetical protein ACF8PG_07435 [Maioricimonas sp. JB045]